MQITRIFITFAHVKPIKLTTMTAYEASNNVTEVSLKRFSKEYAEAFLKSTDSATDRQCNAQNLLTYLCNRFKIPVCTVEIMNKRQSHSTRNGHLVGKKYGSYKVTMHADGTKSGSNRIQIYNLTAVTGKPIAIKTMFDTLLHEFIHHYDLQKLCLTDSPHTKGFYMRLSDLKKKLV